MVFWKPLPFLDSCSNVMSLILCLLTYWYSTHSLLHNNGHADVACISPGQSHTKACQQDNPVSCVSSDISNSSIFVLGWREQVEINEIFLTGLLSRHKLPSPIILNPRRKKKWFIFPPNKKSRCRQLRVRIPVLEITKDQRSSIPIHILWSTLLHMVSGWLLCCQILNVRPRQEEIKK